MPRRVRRRSSLVQAPGTGPVASLAQAGFRIRGGDSAAGNAAFASSTPVLRQAGFRIRGSDGAAGNAPFSGETGGATGSGIPMPATAPTGWTRQFEDDFTTNVALGDFDVTATSVYPGSHWNHYPDSAFVKDTRDKGTYSMSKTIEIVDSMMTVNLHTELSAPRAVTASAATDVFTCAAHGMVFHDCVMFSGLSGGSPLVEGVQYMLTAVTTDTFKVQATHDNGTLVNLTTDLTAGSVTLVRHYCADPCPRTEGNLGTSINANAIDSGRMSICMKCDVLPGYHIVPLMWPASEVWPRDGEICWPECDLDGDRVAQGFMHRMNGADGSDQDVRTSTASPHAWHVYTTEWVDGVSCGFYVDGSLVGFPPSVITSRVPSTPMRWNIQFETNYSTSYPANNVSGKIYVDWVTVDTPA